MKYTRRLNNPNAAGSQYLEDLSTAYFLSESLFAAIEIGLFDALSSGSLPASTLATKTGTSKDALCRFLHVLVEMKLLISYTDKDGETYYDLSTYALPLLTDADDSLAENVKWRRDLKEDWQTLPEVLKAGRRVRFLDDKDEGALDQRREKYLSAMDAVLSPKIDEILPIVLPALSQKESVRILDIGAGPGTFSLRIAEALLDEGRKANCLLFDLPDMLPITKKLVDKKKAELNVAYLPGNCIEKNWAEALALTENVDLVILSNIVHAYDEETKLLLKEAASCLTEDGLLLVHDFFLEHDSLKSALSDINMLINTYNGRAWSAEETAAELKRYGMQTSPMIPLEGDTALLIGSKDPSRLQALAIDPVKQLISQLKKLGFTDVLPFDVRDVVVDPFARLKCSYGCSSANKKTCLINQEKSLRELTDHLHSYTKALLLVGEPPTDSFQRACLQAESYAFKENFYKAFVYWAGPCSICPNCDPAEPCTNTKHHRPSLEGSGVDVFATLKSAGITLKTLKDPTSPIVYTALLLLE